MCIRDRVYGHKGNYGRAVVVAGSRGFTGAAFIATECTVRAGAGLTTLVCSSKDVQNVLENKLIESMTITIDDEKVWDIIKNADTIAVGPGIGTGINQYNMLRKIISMSNCCLLYTSWDKEYDEFVKESEQTESNNEFNLSDKYYNDNVKKIKDNVKGMLKSQDIADSVELDDFKFFLGVCHDLGVKPVSYTHLYY